MPLEHVGERPRTRQRPSPAAQPASSARDEVVALHQHAGNRAVAGLLTPGSPLLQRELWNGGQRVADRATTQVRLQQALRASGYTFPTRVWRIALRALEGYTSPKLAAEDQKAADVIGRTPFASWE